MLNTNSVVVTFTSELVSDAGSTLTLEARRCCICCGYCKPAMHLLLAQ